MHVCHKLPLISTCCLGCCVVTCSFFRTSVNRTYALSKNAWRCRRRIYKILGHNNTRWNSKLHSLESVLKMEDAIRDCLPMFVADKVQPLSEDEWATLKAVRWRSCTSLLNMIKVSITLNG